MISSDFIVYKLILVFFLFRNIFFSYDDHRKRDIR